MSDATTSSPMDRASTYASPPRPLPSALASLSRPKRSPRNVNKLLFGMLQSMADLHALSASSSDDGFQSEQVRKVTIKPNVKLMSNSERGKYYRRKRKLYATELQDHVQKLRRQVDTLLAKQQLRNELSIGINQTPVGSFARVVQAYLMQFEYGTPVVLKQVQGNNNALTTKRVAMATHQQADFLRSAMEENVGFGDFRGIDLLLDQWERYSLYHASLRYEFKSLDVIAGSSNDNDNDNGNGDEQVPPVIIIRADLHVKFSRETIENVFPHLLDDEELLEKFIGLNVTYPCVNHFYFGTNGKIMRYNPEVDFMGAFLRTVRSIEGASHVLSHALIAKDHMIGMQEEDHNKFEYHDGTQDNNEISYADVACRPEMASMHTELGQREEEKDICGPDGTSSLPAVSVKSRLDLKFILS
uniref:BZIP domain-containing protein n=1 Tax=Globisporangium ultimum (strain ATCC 200006 / CBS 805.95 / DAOM BR144) TaxID=431595 RepID=K3WNP4_GLOUD